MLRNRVARADAAAVAVADPVSVVAADATFAIHIRERERNRLLRSLATDLSRQLEPELEHVQLRAGQVLGVRDEPMRYVYFPRDAVVALLTNMEDGTTIESATVGNEGMVGVEVFFADGIPTVEMSVEVAGEAARMHASLFADRARANYQLRATLQRYMLALLNQLARTAACSNLHSVSQRCARWLLMSGDRIGRHCLPVTHDALAKLLGVRRASVTEALGNLQRCGILEYHRGCIRILEPQRLEKAACEDYRLCREAYDQRYA